MNQMNPRPFGVFASGDVAVDMEAEHAVLRLKLAEVFDRALGGLKDVRLPVSLKTLRKIWR